MTDTDTTTAATVDLVDTYFAMWREADPAARRPLIEQAFTSEGRHVDPLADARGHDELDAMIGNVHAHYPDFRMERTTGIDQHGDQLRFGWTLDAADGTPVVAGVDIGELGVDGRLTRIAGFWGDLPARR
jgi:hypothetical protein